MTGDSNTLKHVLLEAEQADFTRDEPMPAGSKGVRKNRNKSVVYSVRLAESDVAALEAVAERLDVPASSLVRGFITEGLSKAQGESAPALVERVAADVERLRSIISR